MMMMKRAILLSLALLLVPANSAVAQVAVSVGVQEIYDTNIYLEDDQPVAGVEVLDPATGQVTTVAADPSVDGDPNEDFITNVYLGLSGAVPVDESVKLGVESKIGSLFFADQDEESRLTLDSKILFESHELLPKPFDFSLSSDLNSQSSDVTVAEGTAARQSTTHTAAASVGVTEWRWGKQTDFSAHYTFARHDFLGELTFQDRDDRSIEEEGSDYNLHGADTVLVYHVDDQLDIDIHARADYYSFTTVESNDLDSKSASDLDRVDVRTGLGLMYVVSDKLTIAAAGGVDITRYVDDPAPREVELTNDDGTTSVVEVASDDTETTVAFDLSALYRPGEHSSLSLDLRQSTGIDIDGDRIVIRSARLSGAQRLTDWMDLAAGGSFTQFTPSDDFSTATERFEVSTSLRFALAPSVAMVLGYNYANQTADEKALTEVFRSEDYESHRVFLGFNAGIVGLT